MPRLTDGLVLHGKYHGAGFAEPTFTVRRIDGQVVQLSQLLYHLVCAIDGARDAERIAARVSATFAREVTAQDIDFLIDRKLQPLGVVAAPGHTRVAADAPRSDLLLALKGRRTLVAPKAVARIARALSWLHYGPIVVLVLLAAAAMDAWLFLIHGAVSALLGVLNEPVLLLAVFGLAVASLLFHEFGHASACHFGGAKPGRIGCGIYLLWPSLFTDVTDVYRITRTGRLRTDLGGVYFNVVYMLALAGIYALTDQPFLLAAIYLGHFEILEQLVPIVRLDGYYILSDLAGVPDLFGQIKPVLRRALPGRRDAGPRPVELTRRSRIIVTTWVATVIPLIAAELIYMVWNLPSLIRTGLRSLTTQAQAATSAISHGNVVGSIAAVLGFLLLATPLAATIYLLARLGRSLVRSLGRTVLTTRARRLAVPVGIAVTVLGVAAGLGAWLDQNADRPALVHKGPSMPSIVPSPIAVTPRSSSEPTHRANPRPTTHKALPTPHSHATASAPATPVPRPTRSTAPPAPATSPADATPSAPPTSGIPSAPPTSTEPTTTPSSTGSQSPPGGDNPWNTGRNSGHQGRRR
ncbi:putative peptide zinc metalloprotease protein [Streptacidiphilus sp. MAP12-16]|uniref:hypothetical protein n=1 Tax=Streptacidiphilus sp. MAP12-16 TaxID=3156300 RepID=UPI0035136B1D